MSDRRQYRPPDSPRGISLGTFLFRLRSLEGLTLQEAAQQAEMDRAYVSKVERGILEPRRFNMDRLGEVHDIPFGMLNTFPLGKTDADATLNNGTVSAAFAKNIGEYLKLNSGSEDQLEAAGQLIYNFIFNRPQLSDSDWDKIVQLLTFPDDTLTT